MATDSTQMIDFLLGDNSVDFIKLVGTGGSGSYGMPIYWADRSNGTYHVRNSCHAPQPPAFRAIRIPHGAAPDPTSDAEMTVYDVRKGLVYGLFQAHFDQASDSWSACGGSVYSLSSNGLAGTLRQSDDPRNEGHRGLPPPVFAIRWDEIRSGIIDHVVKVSVNDTKCAHVFPMIGDECGTGAQFSPPEGTRIRIKPSVQLGKLNLSPAASIVAQALQTYGAVIGDQTGGPIALKVENTVAEGRGQLWRGVLGTDSLSGVPLSDYEVILPGYTGGP